MPRITPREMYSVTEETRRQIDDLASRWGGVGDLPKSQVIREAIRRCWLAEQEQIPKQINDSKDSASSKLHPKPARTA